ncbi:NAD-dependent epimerase/dehydratase family protein [Bacillus sp. NPDC077411]|uniref:NAD-dependent epimerase/dehydratase family protein n=1 Tax=Bacillus bruguierae TaxID=3127667 RepID=A0ABU8FFI1_9BACI
MAAFSGKSVLITGGAGFIGSNLAIRMIDDGSRVTLMDSLIPELGGNLFNIESVRNQVNIEISDIRDWSSLSDIVRNKDYIFNLAGQVGHRYSMTNPLLDMEINVMGHLMLLEACRQYNPDAVVLYTSTRQFYGPPQYLPVDESHPLNPTDINGINKLAAEQYYSLYAKIYGLKTVSLRLTNTFGPRQFVKNAQQGFMGWFINRAINRESIQLFGSGRQLRDFNYVDDVVEALMLASQTKTCYGNVYNLSGEKASLKEVAQILAEICGDLKIETVPFPKEYKEIDIGDFYAESTRFHQESGWVPQVNLYDGLVRTIEYFRKYKDYYL